MQEHYHSWKIFPDDKADLRKKSSEEAELFPQLVARSPALMVTSADV